MSSYEYSWKTDGEPIANKSLRTNKPLEENVLLVDLFDGKRYLVSKIFEIEADKKLWSHMPTPAIQTSHYDELSDESLGLVRSQASYTRDEFSQPFTDIVFG